MHIKIFWVGRTRNSSLLALCNDYLERTCHLASCEIVEIRDPFKGRAGRESERLAAEGEQIAKYLPNGGRVVALDPEGIQFTSEEFARWFQKERNQATRELQFVIGGPNGIDRGIVKRAHLRLSLGKMTWPHEMARVLLLEQIYRALSVLHGIPYHK